MPKISVITTSIRPKGLEITRQSLLKQGLKDFEWLVDINWIGEHDLNRAYNRLIKRAKGELIVSLQDFIKIEADALEKLWEAYFHQPDTFFTCPVGKVQNEDYTGDPKWDWRVSPGATMDWRMWEIDFGACPKSALYAVGGFDESLDGLWSMDNVSVGMRAEALGFKFDVLRDIRGVAYDHDAFIKHPYREQFKPAISNMIMEEYKENPKLSFLS